MRELIRCHTCNRHRRQGKNRPAIAHSRSPLGTKRLQSLSAALTLEANYVPLERKLPELGHRRTPAALRLSATTRGVDDEHPPRERGRALFLTGGGAMDVRHFRRSSGKEIFLQFLVCKIE